MKKLISLLFILLAVLPLSAKKKSAENLLSQDIYSFEVNNGAWWTKYKEVWSITTDKAASGVSCVMYSCDDVSKYTEVKNIQMQGGNKKKSLGLVSLKEGTYMVSLQVWVPKGAAPVGFSTNLKSPFMAIPWKLKNVEKEQWVTLSQEIVVEEATDATNLVLSVSTNPKWGGAGTIYIDDITITKN